MFRALALTAIAAVNAKKVHEFFAENNYMCELCQKIVEYAKNNDDEGMYEIYNQFPHLLTKINSYYPQREEIVDYNDPVGTCKRMELCEDPDIFELLMEEGGDKIDIDLTDPAVEAAATKIQSVFKGFRARKSLQQKSLQL